MELADTVRQSLAGAHQFLSSWSGDAWVAVATFLAAAVALLSARHAAKEYARQGKQKRIEMLLQMRQRFKSRRDFQDVVRCLDADDPQLRAQIRNVDKEIRRDFLGFFEEIALLVNSGVFPPHVAQYMFGYYAIICDECEDFWFDFQKRHLYWSVFNKFAADMKRAEGSFSAGKFKLSARTLGD